LEIYSVFAKFDSKSKSIFEIIYNFPKIESDFHHVQISLEKFNQIIEILSNEILEKLPQIQILSNENTFLQNEEIASINRNYSLISFNQLIINLKYYLQEHKVKINSNISNYLQNKNDQIWENLIKILKNLFLVFETLKPFENNFFIYYVSISLFRKLKN